MLDISFHARVGLLINKVSIADQVYALLLDRIVRRVMIPGERVHIDALAEELGVSRTPIKDALARLESEDLISVIPRRGTFVTRPSAKEFLDLLDVRLGLELWGSRKSLEKLSEADLRRLRGLHEGMVASVAQYGKSPYECYSSFVELNQGFHGTIVQASGNGKLSETYRSIDMAAQIQRVIFPVPEETLVRSNQEHAQILEALGKRDWPSLEHAIITHVETIKQDVLQGIKSLPEKDHT